tara:strand:- start:6961 stop:7065 length:105 start_codon:yes stop_codon:yes gene_type:complete
METGTQEQAKARKLPKFQGRPLIEIPETIPRLVG